uniref:2Fe-2S ferredoxin-type domain-containing protein n=1 Tax=Oryza rufipogon TaxID=4529 RepID=A0A0E0NZP6_ORYRU
MGRRLTQPRASPRPKPTNCLLARWSSHTAPAAARVRPSSLPLIRSAPQPRPDSPLVISPFRSLAPLPTGHHRARDKQPSCSGCQAIAMAPCPAATTTRIGAPPFAATTARRPARGATTTTKARASGLRQVEGPVSERAYSSSSPAPTHKVTVHDRQRGVVHEFVVPQDQYILHTAEAQDITLPFACRHGCCTSCAVRIKSGQIRQPEALGISAELKDKVYWLQFGRYFARGPVERDDYALELAMGYTVVQFCVEPT